MFRKWFSRWVKAAQEKPVEELTEAGRELAPDDTAKSIVTVKPAPLPDDIGKVTILERDFETPPYRRKDRLYTRYPY